MAGSIPGVPVERVQPGAPETVFHQMAEIHREAIHEGFLSTLGPDVLASLYRSLAAGEASFVFAAVNDQRVDGFIAGATDTGAVYKEFARASGVRGVLRIASRLLSPARIQLAVETLLYPSKKGGQDLPEPEILNFCVRPGLQGKGTGAALFQALEDEFQRRGVEAIRIVTGESQVSAQRFYEKHGASLAATTEVHKGAASRVYVYAIGSGTPAVQR